MKKLLIILFSLGLAFGAAAQHHGGRHGGVKPHVSVGIGTHVPYSYGHGFYGFGHSPFYPYPPVYSYRPSRLALEIEDIRIDYKDRIWSAKHDKTLSRSERRAIVRKLKYQRDQAIVEAQQNYYRRRW